MEKLRMLGRRVLAGFVFLLSWICAIRWGDHYRGGWLFWSLLLAGAGLFGVYLNRQVLRRAELEAHAKRQTEVLRLAEAEGGQLTATRTAAKLGWPMRVALATLRSLQDGVRVTTLASDQGVRLYEFPEIIHALERRPPAP